MAEIVVEGFVEQVIMSKGKAFALKVTETHRAKNEAGEWYTKARTYRTVKAGKDTGIDFSQFYENTRVKVVGSEITEEREYEGKKYYDLVVWASSIETLESKNNNQADAWAATPTQDSWADAGGAAW